MCRVQPRWRPSSYRRQRWPSRHFPARSGGKQSPLPVLIENILITFPFNPKTFSKQTFLINRNIIRLNFKQKFSQNGKDKFHFIRNCPINISSTWKLSAFSEVCKKKNTAKNVHSVRAPLATKPSVSASAALETLTSTHCFITKFNSTF